MRVSYESSVGQRARATPQIVAPLPVQTSSARIVKTIILAGGLGSRLQEFTTLVPKPMVEVGGRPLLWHIMKIYTQFGYGEFCIALGYKGQVIKDYFVNYHCLNHNLTVRTKTREVIAHNGDIEDWHVHLIDTGLDTQTGGRVKRLAPILRNEPFMLTYGDGVANVNIEQLIRFHRDHGKLATVTVVRPPGRFGMVRVNGGEVATFVEKPQTSEHTVGGGFFVLEPQVLDYIDNDTTAFEESPLEQLARDGQLMAYRHDGFWQCMDTFRDQTLLNELWRDGDPPWRVWC